MVRTVKNEPAICPICGFDFIGSGKYRYKNLHRHMETQHGQTENHPTIQNIPNNNINYSNCNIYNIFDNSVRLIMDAAKNDSAFISKLTEYMNRISSIPSSIPTTLCLYDKVHCDPEHPECFLAVVPNVSRNLMLVKSPNGDVEAMTKKDGAEKALSIFFERSVPIINDSMKSKTVDTKLASAENIEILPKHLVRKLETDPKQLRSSMTKEMV